MIRDTQALHFLKYSLTKLPFFHLDAFAIGGILCFLPVNKLKFPLTLLVIYLIFCIAFGLLTVATLNHYRIFIGWDTLGFDSPLFQYGLNTPERWLNVRYAFTFTIANIGAGLLISALLSKNLLSTLFSHSAIAFLGRISYGMYILHMPLLVLFNYYFLNAGIKLTSIQEIFLFLAFYIVLVFISWLSYTFFESYFLRLKHRQPHHSA